MTELESKLVQARSDSKAQVKGHNTGRKEMEVSFGEANNILSSQIILFTAYCLTKPKAYAPY